MTLHEKLYAPPTLQLGFEVDGSESSDVDFTLATRLTFLDVAGYRSEWRIDFIFGNTYGVESELYRPFSPAGNSSAPHAGANSSAFKIYRKAIRRGVPAKPGGARRRYRLRIQPLQRGPFGYEVGSLDIRLRPGTPELRP